MLLFRVMSRAEYKKYCAGKKLYQLTDHSDYARSQSQGFCFMDMADVKPQEAFDFLSGIVTRELLCVFECKDLAKAGLIESSGLYYAYPENRWRREYCTKGYSKDTLKLIRCTDIHKWL